MHTIPTVSVVISTYKRANLVPQAIRSVLRQTYTDFEVIVVDDASPDNTREVVESIDDNRVKYIRHEKNKGLSAVRNTGIGAAVGRYIAFLDDDDEWREDKLEKQLEVIEIYDAVVCAFQVKGKCVMWYKKKTIQLSDLRREFFFPPSGLLARASLMKALPFDEALQQGEDWDMLIRIAEKHTIGYVMEPLLLYNDGDYVRMTNQAKNLTVSGLEKRMALYHKHQVFFGPFWFKYHVANSLLSYFWFRRDKLKQIIRATKRCGIPVVAAVLVGKIRRRARRLKQIAR